MKGSRSISLTLALLILVTIASAQSQYPLIFDKTMSHQFGADNTVIAQRGIYSLQDKYIPDTLFKNRTLAGKGANIGYRCAKLFLLDMQEDWLFALTQHEAFGHGARYREFGVTNSSVHISMAFPFGNGHGYFSPGTGSIGITAHENLVGTIGGTQGNQVLANTLACNFLQSDSIHYRQALLYLIAQNDQLFYIWTDRFDWPDRVGGGDMSGYVWRLNNLYGFTDPYTMKELSLHQLVSLANPLQLYCAFTVGYKYAVQGKKFMPKIPMIRFGEVRYLPYFNYMLSPFGGEFQFCNFIRYKNKLLTADFGIGEGTFASTYRFRAQCYNVVRNRFIGINAHVEAWSQPELRLEIGDTASPDNRFGGAVKADIMLYPSRVQDRFSFFAQVGYKTKGFTIGEDLAQTFILRYGICLELP